MKKPYIGITGFKTTHELECIALDYAISDAKNINHRMMLGFLCSSERLSKPNEIGTQSPAFCQLPDLLSYVAMLSHKLKYDAMPGHLPRMRSVPQEDFFPVIHYHTTNPENMQDEVTKVFEQEDIFERKLCRAVQLNYAWPDVKQMENLQNRFPGLEMVLQIPESVILRYNPSDIGTRLQEYRHVAQYALVDESGGVGRDFQITKAIYIMHAIKESCPDMTRIVAGGLSGDNVYDRVSILKLHLGNDFGIDVQGKLRNKDDKRKLCLLNSMNYIHEGLRGFEN